MTVVSFRRIELLELARILAYEHMPYSDTGTLASHAVDAILAQFSWKELRRES